MHHSRSHKVVISVYDEAGNVIETHEHATSQNGYCLTFDLSIAIQPEPAKPCGVPGMLFKLR